VELSTDGEFAPFKGQPASALVLPAQSICSSKTRAGDQLVIRDSEEAAQHPAKISVADAVPVAVDDAISSPLEQFLARQTAMGSAHGRVQQSAKSLMELSPTGQGAPIPTPGSQGIPSVADSSRPGMSGRAMPAEAQPSLEPRIRRISPSRETSFVKPPASVPQTPARDLKPPRSNVAQFPSRGPVPQAPEFPTKGRAPVPQSTEGGDEFAAPSQEKISLLMRILRLQFLHRDRELRQELPLRRRGQGKKSKQKTGSVSPRALQTLRWLYPEFEISTQPPEIVPQSYTSKTKFQQELKSSVDMQFVRWLYPELYFSRRPPAGSGPVDRRIANRIHKPGLVAYYFTGGPPRAHKLSDISVTGFYMHTEDRWMPGTIIRMTLQLTESSGDEPTDTITVNSRVVRWGPDGEGFEFVLAGFMDELLPISYRKSELPQA
jgi:hypothetical protein